LELAASPGSFFPAASWLSVSRHREIDRFARRGPASPSARDVRTMRAWCGAFGKPLLCLIATPEHDVLGYRFDDSESTGEMLELVELFPRDVVIGVDADG
jgi:hypothetical protein